MPRALMLVAANATDDARIDEFNEWYALHVRELLALEGIVSATRWQASEHQMLAARAPDEEGVAGRRFLALYEIECDDVAEMRDRILSTSSSRTHSDTLELDPLPVTVLFEHLGEWRTR